MSNEQLTRWALIAEIVGGLGIIASLMFVGFQVRLSAEQTALNTRQMQANAFSELMQNIAHINEITIEHPELIEIQEKARADEEMNQLEQALFAASARIGLRLADVAWQQYESGIISEENLITAVQPMLAGMRNNPAYLEIWNRQVRNPRFVEYMAALVRETTQDNN
jgi:hypothetical protein